MLELSGAQAEALEALVDERIGAVPAELVHQLEADGLLAPSRRDVVRAALAKRAADRVIEWPSRSTTQGGVLAAFANHCRDDLADVDVVLEERARLEVRWRSEVSHFELCNGFLGFDRRATDTPTMLLGDVEGDLDHLVTVFLDRPDVRGRLAICDLGRLERLGTVRSSAFVYFEWFLRDVYGVKLQPNDAFTRGLIDRGVISLGMG